MARGTEGVLAALALLLLTAGACTVDEPKELLEIAQLEERQHNDAHAKQLYEDIVRLYPSSKEAETARARLSQLKHSQ